jgi:hypothetical protein
MKMVAAEDAYRSQNGAGFLVLTIGKVSGQPVFRSGYRTAQPHPHLVQE